MCQEDLKTHPTSAFLSPFSVQNFSTPSSRGPTRRIRTQIFCEPLQSFRLFALLQSSAGKFWRTCSLTSSKRRQAWFTSGRSTSPTTALLGPTGSQPLIRVRLASNTMAVEPSSSAGITTMELSLAPCSETLQFSCETLNLLQIPGSTLHRLSGSL